MKIKNKLKKLFLAIIPVFCVLSLFVIPKVDAAVSRRLFLGVLLDPERGGVYLDAVEETGAPALELHWGDAYGTGNGERGVKGYCSGDDTSDSGICKYLTFPGVSRTKEQGYSSKDEALALNVMNIMTDSVSKVVTVCEAASKESIGSGDNFYELMRHLKEAHFDLSKKTEIPCYGSGIIEVEPIASLGRPINKDGVNMGTEYRNFVQIRPKEVNGSSSEWTTVQWSVPKGYSNGQYAAGTFDELEETEITPPAYISVSGIAWYGLKAMETSPNMIAGAEGYNTLYGYNEVEKVIMKFFSGINTGIARLFGLNTVDNLIFNRGPVGFNYYKGMMPTRWMEVSKIFYWISMVVGMFILMYGYLVSIGRISLSSISPSVRITLKDTFLNYALVIVLQVLFIPIFNLASNINAGMVDALSRLGGTMTISAMGTGGVISGVISSLISIGISIAINIQYLHRGLMIALLFASAPIFISSIVIDPQRKLFSVWCKELFAYVFMQTFNAVILAFLFMVTF